MDKTLIKTISFFVGGLSIIAAGLFFVLVSDISLLNTSTWLFFAIFTALGSGVLLILTDYVKSNKIALYIMSGLSIVLAAIFIYVVLRYAASLTSSSKYFDAGAFDLIRQGKRKYSIKTITSLVTTIKVVCVVFAGVGMVGQCSYIVMNVLAKED